MDGLLFALSLAQVAGLSSVLFPQHYGKAYDEAEANGFSEADRRDYALRSAINGTLLDSLLAMGVAQGMGAVGKVLAKVGPKTPLSNAVEEGVTNEIAGKADAGYNGIEEVLPNVERVIIDSRKITEYALNYSNLYGGANKARVFESALGYNQSNVNSLMQQIQKKLPYNKAVLGIRDKYGQRFTVDILISRPNGNSAIVRTGWILEPGSDVPRMTTIFVK